MIIVIFLRNVRLLEASRYLFTAVGGDVEDKDGQEGDHDAGQHKGHDVEEGLPVKHQGECEVDVGGGLTAWIPDLVPSDGCLHDVPLLVLPVPL